MKKILIMLLLGALLLTGCNADNADDSGDDRVENESEDREDEEDTEEGIPEEMELFSKLPEVFYFSSGAGGWGTELHINEDGTFYGQYHDSDLGVTGDGYPNGTVYISNFEGKFTAPKQTGEYTYSTGIEYIKVDREGEEYIEDGQKFIVSSPYGLDGAEEIIIYMYGTPRSEIPEGFKSWLTVYEMPADSLERYGLYNVAQEEGFTGSRYEDIEELKKLDGYFENENGDAVTIKLFSDLDSYDHQLGEVEWAPKGSEGERGSIVKNAKGGFTICLEGSLTYDFEMTDYEEGKIKFKAASKYSEQWGTYRMK